MADVRWFLPWLLLLGCGPGPSAPTGDLVLRPEELGPRPRHAEMARFRGGDGGDGGEQVLGEPRPVELALTAAPSAARGTVAFLGGHPDELEGAWVKGRTQPAFYWVSEELDLGPTLLLEAPVAPGLTYLVVINQGSDPLPGPGDLVGGPVAVAAEAPSSLPLRATVDRTFEESASRGGGPRPWTALVEADADVQAGASVTLLLRRSGVQAGGTGLWTWTSGALPIPCPCEVLVPLPEESGELLGFLDVDADGRPGPGDRYLPPLPPALRPRGDTTLRLRFGPAPDAGLVAELEELIRAAREGEARRAPEAPPR